MSIDTRDASEFIAELESNLLWFSKIPLHIHVI